MGEQNLLDRLVSWVSPRTALSRAQARAALNAAMRYEAAASNRRTKGWRTTRGDAASASRGSLGRLRDVSRDLVRNNPWAARGVSAIATNTVGAGIIPQFSGRSQRQTERLETLARAWCDTTACDADSRHDLYGIQLLAMRTVVESGEVLIRRRRRRGSDGLPLPIQLQVMEPDYIDSTKDGEYINGNLVVQGVEFDRIGRRVAYWMYDQHPGAFRSMRVAQSRRVPAADYIHVFRQDRPGQVRGVPWLAPVAMRLNDFHDYEDAQLIRQKIAACYAAFVHMPLDPEAIAETNQEPLGEQEDYQASFEPGMIKQLPPGWKVEIADPPGVDGFGDYSSVTLRGIAAGLGISYEVLSGDLSRVNFSSARMGWQEFQRSIDVWRWDMLAPTMLSGIAEWFLEAAAISAGVDNARVETTWTPPRREMVDPTREVPAAAAAVRAGFQSRSEVIRSYGFDPVAVYDEMASDNAMADERGLVFDSDARPRTAPPAAADGDAAANDDASGEEQSDEAAQGDPAQ